MKTKQYRSTIYDIRAKKPEDGDCYLMPFSSEEPVERSFGIEILDHSESSMDLSRLNNSAPLLWQHNADEQIGVVEGARIHDKRGVASIRFGNSQRAREIKADVDAGIIRNVSVGYQITNTKKEVDATGRNVVRATGWMPLEISFVSIPADQTVGIGRSEDASPDENLEECSQKTTEEKNEKREERTMSDQKTETAPVIDVREVETRGVNEERRRVSEINAIASKHPEFRDAADKAISEGTPLGEFQRELIAKLPAKKNEISANIGMSDKEVKQYSLARALKAMAAQNWKGAELEREASEAVAKLNRGIAPRGVYVPYDVIASQPVKVFSPSHKRSVYDGSTHGAEFIQTDVMTSDFITILRNRLVCSALGARFMSGLIGDVSIPKQSTASSGSWVADGSSASDQSPTYTACTLTPKNVCARVDIYRNLLQQTDGLIRDIVMDDLAQAIALAIDYAAIAGTGSSNQPKGILNSSLANAVYFGTSATDTTAGLPTWAKVVLAETEVATDNGDLARCAYVVNGKTRGKLKTVITSSLVGARYLMENDMMNGYPVFFSNQLPGSSTKAGSSKSSDAIFGDFSQVIIGTWGNGLDVLLDPYSQSSTGKLRIVAFQTCDVAIRQPTSFCKMLNITTS